MIFTIKDWNNNEVKVEPRLELYRVTDYLGCEGYGIAIVLDQVLNAENEKQQYAVLTVSFGELIGLKGSAYIDTNNFPFADQLLEQGIGKDTGFTKKSEFCTYPLWHFSEDFLKSIGEEKYKLYSDRHDELLEIPNEKTRNNRDRGDER